MSARVQNRIAGRLSLRPPQAESLTRLVRALDAAPELMGHEREVSSILSTLKAEFTTLEDFEREFPSLCFALATGVGKTRLMGAFIAYQAQNYSENELHEVFDTYGAELARLIRAEMMAHFWEEATDYEVQVSRGFTELKPCNYTVVAGQTAHNYRETVTELSKIKQMLFGGLAPSVAHSCWTHVRKQAVPTAFGTFFEFASSSSKNVAAGRQADRFGGRRQLGAVQGRDASRSGIRLNPCCGHGPVCRHARLWTAPNRLESRAKHDARHGGRLS